jgi:hypothetical protein
MPKHEAVIMKSLKELSAGQMTKVYNILFMTFYIGNGKVILVKAVEALRVARG